LSKFDEDIRKLRISKLSGMCIIKPKSECGKKKIVLMFLFERIEAKISSLYFNETSYCFAFQIKKSLLDCILKLIFSIFHNIKGSKD
jgi:hypothetical protein